MVSKYHLVLTFKKLWAGDHNQFGGRIFVGLLRVLQEGYWLVQGCKRVIGNGESILFWDMMHGVAGKFLGCRFLCHTYYHYNKSR